MSSEIAIKAEGLSKCYQIYGQPHDRLKQFFLPRVQRLSGVPPKQYYREFWALKDVSFEVKKGETVGIIGRNGSGKSTLLQIITGTLAPTCGSVNAHGRIAALLELGSGFNPEFTGRENVYLNGALLGFSNQQIDEKFDAIAGFADIGEHLDQPVKTYSSGMYVRLAFAVQACIEPEILIVDEALAVGDIGFQYKCFKRMKALKAKGVTILMVTHSTGSILEYADRCLVMEGGRLIGDTTDVLAAVMAYEKGMILSQEQAETLALPDIDSDDECPSQLVLLERQRSEANLAVAEKRFGSARAIIAGLTLVKGDGTPFHEEPLIKSCETLTLRFELWSSEVIEDVALGISLSRAQGGDIWGDNNIAAGHPLTLKVGRQIVTYQVTLPINSGDYLLHCGLASLKGGEREELDQRRPMQAIKFWSSRELGGVVHAPITVLA